MNETIVPREKPEECDCCQYETPNLKSYRPNVGSWNMSERWLCALCAGTMVSTWDGYRQQHDYGILQAMKTICYVGNAILDRLPPARAEAQSAASPQGSGDDLPGNPSSSNDLSSPLPAPQETPV